MRKTRKTLKLVILLAAAVGLITLDGPPGLMAQDEAALQPTRPGLNLEITGASINEDRRPVVTFAISDNAGLPLDRTGLYTEGAVSTSFLIARIGADDFQYTSYITRSATGDVSGTVQQPTSDSGGTYAQLSDGMYQYTYGSALPEDYDPNVTHTVGIYANRDLRDFDGRRYVANAVYNFIPAGGEVTKVRDVVRTEACNQCHNVLALHGGSRRETALCILCHQPQNVDPDTGNTVDFKVMIHKIHMGENLPSVQAGTPYQIIGFRGSVHDYSDVEFPPSIGSSLNNLLNCTRCHVGSQGENWKTRPSRAACGSCHDNVNFQTGLNHEGGPQPNDTLCGFCHPAEGNEFDLSISGAHTVPGKSSQLLNPQFEIVAVTNTGPGQSPTVTFNIKDKNGNAIAPAEMDRARLTLAGPTTDYTGRWQEDARGASGPDASGNYSYTFSTVIPPEAQGSYAVGIEGYKTVTLDPGPEPPGNSANAVRDAGFNEVFYFAVTDSAPVARRQVVDVDNCNRCHDQLGMHSRGVRRNTSYCVMCHNPTFTDRQDPPDTLHFKVLVHKIHRGEELENEYLEFNEGRFPGDLNDCGKCHVQRSQLLPLPPGVLPTVTPRASFRGLMDPTLPITAACTACHDSFTTAAHTATMTAGGTQEACVTCHGEGKEFAVSKVHLKVPEAIQ